MLTLRQKAIDSYPLYTSVFVERLCSYTFTSGGVIYLLVLSGIFNQQTATELLDMYQKEQKCRDGVINDSLSWLRYFFCFPLS